MEQPLSRRDALKAGFALTAGGLLAACGSSGSSSTSSTATTTTTPSTVKPKRGGTLRVGLSGGTSSDTVNPLRPIQTLDFARIGNLYDPLFKLDKNAHAIPVLASEITPNKTATTWTVRVPSGVEFHNGKELTADDVVFTFQQILNKKFPGWQAPIFAPLVASGIKKIDKYTTEFQCSRPFSVFTQALALSGASDIIPVGYNDKAPVGTGPFKYQSFTPGEQSTFLRNQNYWQTGLPYTDELVIVDYADETTQSNALISGEADIVAPLSFDVLGSLRSAGMQVITGDSYECVMFTMRVDEAPFTDVRVRQAFKYAVDRPEFREIVFGGYGSLGNDMLGFGAPEYDASIPQRTQDIGKAKSLLKAAGQEKLNIQLVTGAITQGTVESAEVLAQQVAAAGIQVSLDKTTPTNVYGSNYLKWLFAQDYTYYDFLFPVLALFMVPGGPFNETHFDNARFNTLFNQGMSTLNTASRIEIGHELCNIQFEESGYIIPVIPPVISAARPTVRGIYPAKDGLTPNTCIFSEIWFA